jgi:hypothetical protein
MCASKISYEIQNIISGQNKRVIVWKIY